LDISDLGHVTSTTHCDMSEKLSRPNTNEWGHWSICPCRPATGNWYVTPWH